MGLDNKRGVVSLTKKNWEECVPSLFLLHNIPLLGFFIFLFFIFIYLFIKILITT